MDIKRLTVGFLQANCYIAFGGQEALVIDPGGEPEEILKQLSDKKAVLKYLIFTHSHFDHTAGGQQIKALAGGLVLIHKREKAFIDFKPDRWLGGGEEIAVGSEKLKVFSSPGHTPGSICLLGSNFIFTGDTLFANGWGRTDLAGGSEIDMKKTLDKLSKIIKPGMKVYPGHGEPFIA